MNELTEIPMKRLPLRLASLALSCLFLYGCCTKMELPSPPSPKEEQASGKWSAEFEENFSSLELGSEPENLFILDGAYAVSQEENDKRLTLPGSPVGDFGLLFGPRVREKNLSLSFSFLASKKGRRVPALAAGLGGVRSYRFRLNAATREILLFRQDVEIGKVAYQWESGAWTQVRFQALPGDGEKTRIRLKLWKRGEDEPDEWLLDQVDPNGFAGGKCALWAYPYAGTPIHFDDLKIESKAL
ncbi:MAG: hypothetical protein CMI25_03955 [Opitutae bacterium]|nr:hypothetical protein [Opitutae bacterium]